jgi:DNA topoisomerase-1
LRTVGEHPEGGEITVHSGRYGPYVKWDKINATLPETLKPETVTLAEALALIAEKKPVKTSRKAAPKKAAPKKAAAKAPKPKATKAAAKPRAATKAKG